MWGRRSAVPIVHEQPRFGRFIYRTVTTATASQVHRQPPFGRFIYRKVATATASQVHRQPRFARREF